MSYVDYQPLDNNLLSTNNFKLVFSDFPKMEYFVQEFSFPNTSLSDLSQPSPYKGIPIAGNQINYGNVEFTFTVSEDLKNYIEVYNWLVKSGTPKTGNEYQDVKDLKDCTLFITSNNKNPILKINFSGIFPISLSGFSLNVTNAEFTPVTASAEFTFNTLSFDRHV